MDTASRWWPRPPTSRLVRPVYDRQVDLSTRLAGSRLRPALLALQRPWGARLHRLDTPDHPTWVAAVPENGFRTLLGRFRPDVVVGNSIERVSWRRLRALARDRGIPTVLYLREASAIGHLTITGAPPDLLLANAVSLAEGARGPATRARSSPRWWRSTGPGRTAPERSCSG